MIAIVDVCSGNLRSVERALAHVGGDVVVTRDPEAVRRADRIVVPGQGAFGVFMRGLEDRGLGEVLRAKIASGAPYLGICLGMQVLFEHSEEGDVAGLGVFAGDVVRFRPTDPTLKVPHMGWNDVALKQPTAGLADGAYVYFVHSYHCVPRDPALVAVEATHGVTFCAAVQRDNVFACQFHPEKSQAVGLGLLRTFVERT
ncbi:MAG: imidazole glycerol phosphate synthase subunit HisH [Deltaproteobacteria bacterium]